MAGDVSPYHLDRTLMFQLHPVPDLLLFEFAFLNHPVIDPGQGLLDRFQVSRM